MTNGVTKRANGRLDKGAKARGRAAEPPAGLDEPPSWAAPRSRQVELELPLPDFAPFAVPSDELWRELQRRRNLVRMVETLSQSARDEGLPLSAHILADAAEKLREALIQSGMTRLMPEPKRAPARRRPKCKDAAPAEEQTRAARPAAGAASDALRLLENMAEEARARTGF